MNNNLENWYRKNFNSLHEAPPADAWENIEQRIDVDEVWGKVGQRLDTIQDQRNLTRRIGYAFIALFIAGSVSFGLYKQFSGEIPKGRSVSALNKLNTPPSLLAEQKDNKISSSGKNNIEPFANTNEKKNTLALSPQLPENNLTNKGSDKNSIIASTKIKEYSSVSSNTHKDKTPTITDDNFNKASNSSRSLTEINFYCAPILIDQINTLSFSDSMPLRPLSFSKSDLTPSPAVFNGFYIGSSFGLNSTWMFDHKTMEGFSRKSFTQNNLHIGHDLTLQGGYNFNKGIGVLFDWDLRSNSGQTYHTYDEGVFTLHRITCTYTQFDLAVKFRKEGFNYRSDLPRAISFTVGPNIKLLQNATETIGAVTHTITDEYSPLDLGIHLAFEYELLLNKHFIASAGISSNVGLMNIYKGSKDEPGDFDRTYNTSVGLTAGIKYLFSNSSRN